MRKVISRWYPFGVICILGIVLLSPLLQGGFYPMHDDTQVTRVHQMAKSLSDGMFPVRWVDDLGYGYGYPIFNFYAPLAYYVGSLFVLVGLTPLVSTKIMIVLPLFIAGGGMYLLAKEFWGRNGGLISGVLVMSAPYVAVNIFVRGAISEYYAYSFIPLVFFFLVRIYSTQKLVYVLLGSLSFAAIVLSHNLTAMMLSVFLILLCIVFTYLSVRNKTYRGLLLVFGTLGIGSLLSAFYSLPAILEMSYTNVSSQVGGGADFREHFVCPLQLWESQWGFGGSVPGCIDGMSFRVGKLHVLLGVISLPLLFLLKRLKMTIALFFGTLSAGISVFFLLPISQVVWETITPFEYIQYPWRFLSILILSLSFVSGSVLLYKQFLPDFKNLKRWFIPVGVTCIFALIYVLYVKLFSVQTQLSVTSETYTQPEAVQFSISRISDEYLPKGFEKPSSIDELAAEKVTITEGEGDIQITTDKTQELSFEVSSSTSVSLLIHTAYFPAWQADVNGNKVSLAEEKRGMSLSLPEGDNKVRITFVETPVEKLGNTLSVIGILLLIIGIIFTSHKRSFR